ncbi:phage tail protein [Coprobacter tertius]|uniref:Phage tail protein n=1 Tax=Coprobacter tertius TaxID=2944915 RepID=A0ABT1MI08_9BACT|nr:phage tail protein [Coprobacter tertius]MCP9611303.1 phage tail protein [Coprobacter tertius]
MEQIIVRHPDGTTALLTSRARKSGVTKAEQSITLLGADTVAITVKSATPLTFHLGDQIDVYGKTYTLNQLPGIKKTGNRNFEYTLTFEGVQYELIDVQFLLPDDTVLDSFTGDLEDFLGILIGNLTRVYPGKWVLGIFPANTEYKTLTYTEKNCLEVLQDFCTQWGTEFEITQANGVRTLNIKTAGVNFPYTFRYGRTGGLYELTRQNINSKNVVTRLYVYGGNSNLGNKYRYSRLCLPGKAKNASYIENAAAIAAYGLKENTKIFDDIRPERYGEVTAAGSAYYAFKDATMNFDLNEKDSAGNTKWLIDGATAKVKFTTGNLAGYEFDIHKYDHATKEIQVVPFTDENGMKFPSETSAAFQFGVGDKYFFTDINLPDAYKTDAENKLLAEGNKAIAEYSQPQVQYGLSIDENFIRQFAGELTVVNLFAVGDYIPVEDEDIGVNKSVRITAFTRDLLREYKYNITLGDSVTKTTITRVIEDLQKIDNVIEINDLADPSKARRNWKASQEVLANVFDPEGHYYSEKIKPLSIETTMLATGARSQQFVLQNTRFEPNYEGNPNTVKVVGGTLVHYTIAETVKSWQLNTATFSNLVSGTVYYIYARCQKTGTAGNIVFDTVQRKVDSDPTYYYFLVGSLSSAITDTDGKRPARLIALTYGATTINGRFLTTGRVQSADGQTYFDLDAGEIGGNIKFVSSDGSIKDVADLEEMIGDNNKVYTAQPIPPYKKGDIWVDGKVLRKCNVTRTTGNFVASDWVEAVEYDNTQTVINGGIVTSGTVQLAGNDSTIKAGITGEGTSETSVRFWAGATKANRASAPFRVLQDGSMYTSKGIFAGYLQTPFIYLGDSDAVWNSTRHVFQIKENLNIVSSGLEDTYHSYEDWIELPFDEKYIGARITILNNRFPPYTRTPASFAKTVLLVSSASQSSYIGIGGKPKTGTIDETDPFAIQILGRVIELLCVPYSNGQPYWIVLNWGTDILEKTWQ